MRSSKPNVPIIGVLGEPAELGELHPSLQSSHSGLLTPGTHAHTSPRPHTQLQVTPVTPGKLISAAVSTVCFVPSSVDLLQDGTIARWPWPGDGRVSTDLLLRSVERNVATVQSTLGSKFVSLLVVCTSGELGSCQLNEGLKMRAMGSRSPPAPRVLRNRLLFCELLITQLFT